MMKKMTLALTLAVVSIASSAYAVEPAMVDNTSWDVGALNDGTMVGDKPHAIPWVFHKDGTVSAKGAWTGVWASWPGSNEMKVTIIFPNGASDTFEVKFLTSKWFVATQGNALYRVGKKK
ncbi:MAG: hypothetical protein JXB05_37830 [Myxococcaceae bacterium]|nr:hypothetical protein [Myxococcaceae bacterium]